VDNPNFWTFATCSNRLNLENIILQQLNLVAKYNKKENGISLFDQNEKTKNIRYLFSK